MPAVMFGLVVMSVLGIASLRASGDEQRSVQAFRESSAALFAAEAGLRRTIANWPTTTIATMNPGDSLNLDWQSMTNGARYRAVIHEVDNTASLQVYMIVVQGRGPRGTTGQRTVEAVIAAQPLFKYAVYATGTLKMGSNTLVDGFNSEKGAYNALTADSTGDVVSMGNMTLGPTLVKGNATSAGTISNSLLVTGAVTQSSTTIPTFSTVPCPTTGYTPASQVPTGPGVNYNATTGELQLTASANLILTGAKYYFSSIRMSGQSTITVNSANHVDLYVANEFSLGGQGIVNSSMKASQLTVSACGNPVNPPEWQLAGGASAIYSVYAPDRDLKISGHTDTFGAVLGKDVEFSGSSLMHYDASLLNNAGLTFAVVGGSWAELTLY
jgi:hypothetical protein